MVLPILSDRGVSAKRWNYPLFPQSEFSLDSSDLPTKPMQRKHGSRFNHSPPAVASPFTGIRDVYFPPAILLITSAINPALTA